MTGASVMNRLVQGDVGSGKTAVSMCAMFVALFSGFQAAMLAPTEVLARQNYEAAKRAFPDYNVGILVGSMSAKEKREIKTAVNEGSIRSIAKMTKIIFFIISSKKIGCFFGILF